MGVKWLNAYFVQLHPAFHNFWSCTFVDSHSWMFCVRVIEQGLFSAKLVVLCMSCQSLCQWKAVWRIHPNLHGKQVIISHFYSPLLMFEVVRYVLYCYFLLSPYVMFEVVRYTLHCYFLLLFLYFIFICAFCQSKTSLNSSHNLYSKSLSFSDLQWYEGNINLGVEFE